ncbi:hypothetical protein GMORB2_1138 [Geosmithia morbida]|uniref:Uncharacterized protein n=1 Tax=Geosmithia morbida TaxID=1094350 RepID=A0A9P4Z0G9_9HYPO|nr:uncharacterized protein GMORB2_1138 [Geosmithia morbida]KAF4125892.1 hypothetical protein GMORB2_1138 [Geosmithia morbida]
MAAPMRNALRGTTANIYSASSPATLRRLTVGTPARAQQQAVIADNLAGPLPPPPPPPSQQRQEQQHSTSSDLEIPPSKLEPVPSLSSSSKAFFDSTGILWVGVGNGDNQPSDPNKAKLGKTLRILQERLPTLLQSPLPQDILSPTISLHLFPSTHPHLPTVSGRVAYNAALWTSPIAWNRVPIIGNVRLEILAERMTTEPLTFLPRRPGAMPEQLVVRWTEKCRARHSPRITTTSHLATVGGRLGGGVDPNEAFTGLFIFDFDREGRILSHTIETAQEGGDWEKGMGAKFVGLTDWLLGGIRDPGNTPAPIFERLGRR